MFPHELYSRPLTGRCGGTSSWLLRGPINYAVYTISTAAAAAAGLSAVALVGLLRDSPIAQDQGRSRLMAAPSFAVPRKQRNDDELERRQTSPIGVSQGVEL